MYFQLSEPRSPLATQSNFWRPAAVKRDVYSEERWLIHAFYISEIITVNLRCYLKHTSCDAQPTREQTPWLIIAITQTVINFVVFCGIFWAQGRQSIFTNLNRAATFIAWLLLLLVNLAQGPLERICARLCS